MKSTVGVLTQDLTEDGTDKRVCGLASKQIHDADVKVLTTSLEGNMLTKLRNETIPPGQIRKLVLRDNMLTDKGVQAILRNYITAQEGGGRQVEILDIGGNPIGRNGAMLFKHCFSRLLVGGGGTCALKKLSLASTGLGVAGIVDVASWLETATQLVELDLSGNREFGAAAMEGVASFRETKTAAVRVERSADDYEAAIEVRVGAIEKHGHVVVTVDKVATTGLPHALVARFELANKSNMATNYLAGGSSL